MPIKKSEITQNMDILLFEIGKKLTLNNRIWKNLREIYKHQFQQNSWKINLRKIISFNKKAICYFHMMHVFFWPNSVSMVSGSFSNSNVFNFIILNEISFFLNCTQFFISARVDNWRGDLGNFHPKIVTEGKNEDEDLCC